jgi:hypothetical protein
MRVPMSADYWRQRAEEIRTRADGASDLTARRALLALAENYDQLVRQAEGKAHSSPSSGAGQ